MYENIYSILKLMSSVNLIYGRKKFQKIVQILQTFGFPFEQRFVFHLFGPYSQELQNDIDMMVEDGLLIENTSSSGAYIYLINKEKAEKVISYLENNKMVSTVFPEKGSLIRELNEQEPSFLELISTNIYLNEMGYNNEEIREKIRELKPHLFDRYDEAVNFIEKLEKKYKKTG
ncbi:hypothetical protein [Thermosediminibacter litoriperuensis]|uniref:Uncharacterized protein n=1 Tax=Thermosediminibacter litoriperuensis TaxID=291989 RepID=A0A5S5AMZ7_9FIRM|nr:hypothetical protein [Thermosediminibacter litoriperuensis]TYP52401.1 hypothetical protein LZ11_01745 [Thermosediminibacter litoriperuensis]